MARAILYGSRHYTAQYLISASELNDYAHAARQRNLRGFTVSCQDCAPNADSEGRSIYVESIAERLDVIDRVRRDWIDRVDVRLGVRIVFVPGNEVLWRALLRSAVYDCVVCDIAPAAHFASAQPWPYFDRLTQYDAFRRAGDAAETGLFDCVSVGDILENACRWHLNLESIASEATAAMDRIANSGAAIELLTASRGSSRISAFDAWFLTELAARRIPVVLNAAPQTPWHMTRGFETTLELLAACGFSHVSHFINRQRIDVPLETARGSLQSLEEREVLPCPPVHDVRDAGSDRPHYLTTCNGTATASSVPSAKLRMTQNV